jgi:hypothetical protein
MILGILNLYFDFDYNIHILARGSIYVVLSSLIFLPSKDAASFDRYTEVDNDQQHNDPRRRNKICRRGLHRGIWFSVVAATGNLNQRYGPPRGI